MRNLVGRVARWPHPVLITGAPGTGKSLIAKDIHERSLSEGELVEQDCGQLHAETEINNFFGWEKGAFTDAKDGNPGTISQADHGTLLLDEIGNAPESVQKHLLRILQAKKYRPLGALTERDLNTRVIAATNTDLVEAVREGRFRQDLLDRLLVLHIQIPPLQDRKMDIIPLAQFMLNDFYSVHAEVMRSAGNCEKRLSPAAEKALLRHDWPGNVRELQSLIARLVIYGVPKAEEIGAEEVQRQLFATPAHKGDTVLNRELDDEFDLASVLKDVEWHYVHRAAEQTSGNRASMARILGYGDSRTPINTMIKNFPDYGLPDPLL